MQTPYQVMARSLRPQKYKEVVGQEKIIQTLMNARAMNRLGHAYLFSGPHGTGKTTLARLFSKALNCEHLEDNEPCGVCSSCKEITQGNSLNVIEIDGASNRGIDDIRQINETVGYAPASAPYKIYIIDEVHMLTKEAFNALLKTLEDPPEKVKFLFATTEPHKMPDTILSRCQCFYLKAHSTEEVQKHLMKCSEQVDVSIDPKAALLIAERTLGSIRDALVLTDQLASYAQNQITLKDVHDFLGILPLEAFFEFDEKAHEGQLQAAFELVQNLVETGKSLPYFLDSLAEHYRKILTLKVYQGKKSLSINPEYHALYEKSMGYYSYDQCLYILDLILEKQAKFKSMVSKQIALENLLLEIIRSYKRVSLESLLLDIEKLKRPQTSNEPQPVLPKEPPKKEPKPPIAQKEAPKEMPPQAEMKPREEKKIEEPKKNVDSKKDLPSSTDPLKGRAKKEKSRYDTLLQFAAIELEGSLKKEG